MQKFKFICLILLLCASTLLANDNKILQLYRQNNFVEIERLLNAGQIAGNDLREFSEILFLEDGDEALTRYVALHERTDNDGLKTIIVDRLSQYYYAKGLYNSANRVIDDAQFRSQIFSSNTRKIFFGVQVGAFSSHENAASARGKYEVLSNDIYIVPKTKKGKKLYTVVVGKYSGRDDAINMKRQIAQKLQQTGMIIQY